MIRINYFIACMGDWRDVVGRQVEAVRASGLYDAAGEINVCVGRENEGCEYPKLPAKYRIRYWSFVNQFEFPALRMVCEFTKSGDHVLYLHTKGVSRPATHRESARQWCDYMTWGCVEHWREMVAALDSGKDLAGVQWTNLDQRYRELCGTPAVFAGNFWWATGKYIQRLVLPEVNANRYLAEGWVVGANPAILDWHNLTGQGPVGGSNGPAAKGFCRTSYTHEPDITTGWARVAVLTGKRAIRPRSNSPDPKAPAAVLSTGPRARHEIINGLIQRFRYKSYLEIGVYQFACFNAVRCETKHCVDPGVKTSTFPVTSDEFFKANTKKYDIVFIDGLHCEDQVFMDVQNALACLSPGGTIVMHDCNPETEYEQRDTPNGYDGKGVWLGTTWRAWARLRMTRPDLEMAVVDCDFGCGVIRRGSQALFVSPGVLLSYGLLARMRNELLNLLDPEAFGDWIDLTVERDQCSP